MDAQFHTSAAISREVLRELARRDDWRSGTRFVTQYLVLWASAAFVVSASEPPWWQVGPAVALFGCATAAMYATCHETIHGTAFRNRWLNRLVLWLAAVPILYTPTGHGEYHFAHHRHTQDARQDPEIAPFAIAQPSATSSIIGYVLWMTGLAMWLYKIGVLLAGCLGWPSILWRHYLYFVPERARTRFRLEACLVLGLHLAVVYVGWTAVPAILWLYVGQILGHFLITAQTSGDHQGLAESGSILDRTRSIGTTGIVRYIFWNMPYHAEHHAYPVVPWHALPRLNRLLAPELTQFGHGYVAFHRYVLDQVFGRWNLNDTAQNR